MTASKLSVEKKRELLQKKINKKLDAQMPNQSLVVESYPDKPGLLSYSQQRLWILNKIDGGSSHYNIPAVIELKGCVDINHINHAFVKIIERHEILRTRFKEGVDGEPRQFVLPNQPFSIKKQDLSGLKKVDQAPELDTVLSEICREEFNLERDLLMRVHLLKLGESHHILVVNLHHIVSDGWSVSVLVKEFSRIYRALVEGKASELESLKIQYSDFAHWQRKNINGDRLEAQLKYWEKQLESVPEIHSLPLDRPRPDTQSFEGGRYSGVISHSVIKPLQEICNEEKATLFMGLHAVFAVFISRYSGQKDIAIGTPSANREQAEIAELIGFFVNTLVLRTDLNNDLSFREVVRISRRTLVDAYAHQQVPFEKIVERVQPERSLSHNPLCQIMLVFQNNEKGDINLPGLDIQPINYLPEISKYDLTLNIGETENGLCLDWEYSAALFDASTIENMHCHFKILLEELLNNADDDVFSVNMLSNKERKKLFSACNSQIKAYPQKQGIHSFFEEQAKNTPLNRALIFERETGETEQISYLELNERANQLAHLLIDGGKIGKGTLVGLCLDKSINMIVGVLAILKAGAAYVPLDPDYPEERIKYMVDDSGASIILSRKGVFDSKRMPGLDVSDCQVIDIESATFKGQLSTQPNTNPTESGFVVKPTDLAYVIYTSGSTGKPKGVMVEHDGLMNMVDAQKEVFCADENSRILQFASISFDAAIFEICMALTAGATLCIPGSEIKSSTEKLLNFSRKHRVSHATLPPSLLSYMKSQDWRFLQNIIVAGEQCSFKQACIWSRGRKFYNAYGPTEASVWSTTGEVDYKKNILNIGRPIQNTVILILNEKKQLCPIGAAGEIYIGGVGLARGYLNKSSLTDDVFIENPFKHDLEIKGADRLYKTGDLARWVKGVDGNKACIQFLGRVDNQVKVRGFRVELGEIEHALCLHPEINDALVTVDSSRDNDNKLVAYLLYSGNKTNTDDVIDSVRQFLGEKLPRHMQPTSILLLDAFPLTPNGKVDHKLLPKHDGERNAGKNHIEPRTDTEIILRNVWVKVLGIKNIGADDNFFHLGGHSLLVINVIAELKNHGIEMEVRQIFTNPVLADLAAAIDKRRQSSEAKSYRAPANRIPAGCKQIFPEMLPLVVLSKSEIEVIVSQVTGGAENIQDIYPLAPLQEGILFHHMLAAGKADPYIMPVFFSISGEDVLNAFLSSMQVVVDRHDVLRTTFFWKDISQPVQVVQRQVPLQVNWLTVEEGMDAKSYVESLINPDAIALRPDAKSLLNIDIAKDSDGENYFILMLVHHLVADHVGLEVVQQEFMALMQNPDIQLKESVSYREFVAHTLHYSNNQEADLFFTKMLGDVTEPSLPFGLTDIQGDGSEINEDRIELSQDISSQIRLLSQNMGVTPASIFHAAWAVVVGLCCGRKDIVFGTVLSGRLQGAMGSESMLGNFINTLPVRVNFKDVAPEKLVRNIHTVLTDLVSFEQTSLTRAQSKSELSQYTPLFSALLNYRHSSDLSDHIENAGVLENIQLISTRERTNYPFHISVDDYQSGFMVSFQIINSVDIEKVKRYLLSALEFLTESISEQKVKPISFNDILSSDEIERQVDLYNRTNHLYPSKSCIHELFEEQVKIKPNDIAIEFNNSGNVMATLSFSELNTRANQLAHYLISDMNILPGDLVGLCMNRSPDMLVAVIGTLKAGAAYVPIDPAYPVERVAYMLADAKMKTILSMRADADNLKTIEPSINILYLDDCEVNKLLSNRGKNDISFDTGDLSSESVAYVIYTSGSTGKPKGVKVTHRSVVNYSDYVFNRFCDDKSVSIVSNPLAFDGVGTTLFTLFYGCRLILLQSGRDEIVHLANYLLQADRPYHFKLTPSHLSAVSSLIRSTNDSGIVSQPHTIFVGGEVFSKKLAMQWQDLLPAAEFVNHYGPTEATIGCCFYPLEKAGTLDIPCSSIPIGNAMGNRKLYVLTQDNELVPEGVVGELYIGGEGLALGYLNNLELSGQRFVDNPFEPIDTEQSLINKMYKTGDLVRWNYDKKGKAVLEFVGRVDHQVKIRGYRIELGEIEYALVQHPQIDSALVVKNESKNGHVNLVAYIVGEVGVSPSNKIRESIRQQLRETLPEYMIPKYFVFLDDFPITVNGKLDRRALPEPEVEYADSGYLRPETEMEVVISAIWEQVLDVDCVGCNDNFFHLGGHSILLIQVLSRLLAKGINTTAHTLYSTPVLADLAKKLEKSILDESELFQAPINLIPADCDQITPSMLPLLDLEQNEIDEIVANVDGGVRNIEDIYPLAPLQEGILFHHRMVEEGGDPYVMANLFKIQGDVSLRKFLEALQGVVNRHDVLRTSILWEGLSQPVQVVHRKVKLPVFKIELSEGENAQTKMTETSLPESQNMDLSDPCLVKLSIANDPGQSDYYILLQIHHIISDHICLELIQQEFNMFMLSRETELPKPIPYREFVAKTLHQAQTLDSKSFFQKKLADLENTSIPFGLENIHGNGAGIIESSQDVPREIHDKIRDISLEQGVSPAAIFHAAWSLVVGICSGCQDVVFGTVMSGRLQGTEGAERMLGTFINTLPLRINLNDLTANDFVRYVHSELLALLEFEQASLTMAQACSGLSGEKPLFTALFNFRHSELLNTNIDEIISENNIEHLVSYERTNYPIILSVDDFKERFALTVQIDKSINVDSVLFYMQSALHQLVDLMDRSSSMPITTLNILPKYEYERVAGYFNEDKNATVELPLIHTVFEKQVEKIPNDIALLFPHSQLNTEQITYKALNERANQFAHYLMREFELEKGRFIGLFMERSIDLIVAILAVLKSGKAYTPLDSSMPEKRLEYILKDAEIDVVITNKDVESINFNNDKLVDLKNADIQRAINIQSKENVQTKNQRLSENTPAYLIYTSGSTGDPKGVVQSHATISNLLNSQANKDGITRPLKTLQFTNVTFDVSIQEIATAWFTGSSLVVMGQDIRDDMSLLPNFIKAHAIERIFVTPAVLSWLLDYESSIDGLREIFVAGEELKPSSKMSKFLSSRKDCVIWNHYGPTETHVVSTERVTQGDSNISIGKIIENTGALIVVQGTTMPCPMGIQGELLIAGKGLAIEYLNKPDLTAEKYITVPLASDERGNGERRVYRTGDIVRYTPDMKMEFHGRIDHQVKIRGYRIELGEIEKVLSLHDDISEAAVIVRVNENGDKNLVAYLVGRGELRLSEEALQNYLEAVLPSYMLPNRYKYLPALPLTSNGKINKKALPHVELDSSRAYYEPPTTQTQIKLCEIWKKLFQVDKVGISDNFFHMGGHSLLAMQLTSLIERELDTSVSIKNILETPSLKDIAKIIDAGVYEKKKSLSQIVPDEIHRYEPFPLTAIQQAYWLGRNDDFEMGNIGTHSYREITLRKIDIQLFEKQFNQLIQRHDMMRMIIDDNGMQRVIKDIPFYSIKVCDLTNASEKEISQHKVEIRNEMSHQVFKGSVWPLFDVRFSRYKNKIVLHYSIDALMLDISSMLIIARELFQLLTEPEIPLPPLELRFRDYVLAEVALRETPIFKKAESYWLSRIEDFPPRPDLPLATDPSQISNPRFERRHNTLSAQHWQVLKARAQQHQLTPTVLFLGCFAEVLNRWSQQAHFALNLTLFNRMPFHPQVNDILGDFTTLTLLEMDYREAGKHFLERLDAIQKQLWSDLEHREFGGIDFLRALHSAGESNSYPVVVTSTLGLEKADNDAQNNADNNTHNNDWLIEDESYGISQTSQVWLDVQVGESESGGLSYNWDSVAELFPAGMLDDMFSALGHLLEHLATQETLWQKPIKIDLPPAQQQLIEKVNSTTMSLPEGLLHEPILEQIAEQGDKVAVTTADYSLSYRELGERSQQLAHHLIQGGARANQLIAIVMEKGWEQVVAVLGILRSGAAYLPIDGSQPEERIHLLLESAEVEQVVTTQAYREKIPAALRTLVLNHDDDKQKLSTQDSPVQNKTTDLAYVIFTSGSTGIPKGVMIDHRGALNTVNDINQRYQVSSADSVFGLSNLNFDLSVYDIFGVLGAGGTLVLPCAREYRDPAAWLKYLHANQVTLWNTVPALMQMLVEHLDGQDNTTTEHQALNLRLVLMSGDWIPVDLPDRIRTLAPDADLISLGGATEASIWSIYYPIQDVGKQWKSIPYGKALANQQFYVLQSDLQLSAPGVTGDLYIGGIGLAQGYWRDEEKTAASFIQHPDTGVALYRTGDRGRLLADGNIEFMGRIDQQVKVQGYRIELGEIEARLKAHPQVHDTVVSTFRANNSVQLVAYVAGEKREADAEGQADTLSASEKIDFKLSHKSVRNEEGECISLETGTEMLTLRSPSLPVSKPVFDALALSDLSALLKIFYRKPITGQALPKGYYPSGGTLYPVQVYLHIPANTVLLETGAIAAGYYYYHPLNHQLVLLTREKGSEENNKSQENKVPSNSSPTLFLIGDLDAIAPLYGQASQGLCELEAGYMSALLLQYQGHVGAEEQPRALLTDTQKAAFKLTEQHHMLTRFRCGKVSEENTTEQNNTALTVRCASNGAPCQFQFSGEAAPQALSCINRKSYRQYQEAAPSLEQLGQLLSVLPLSSALHYYINLHKDHHASDSDVRLPAGQYQYDVSTNSLRIVQTGNVGKLFTGGNQEIEARASFSLFISSASSEEQAKNLQEAGRIGQHLSNQVKASRTGLCPIGAVNDAAVANAFNLDASEKVLHSFIGGAVSQAQIDNPEVESTAPAAQSIESVLSEHLAQTLPHYMIPSHFIVLESIPLTANGKVNRKALPEPDVEHEVQAYVAPTNETETQLCKLWQDILNVERVGITDNFFHLGGHSLLAVQLTNRIKKEFNVSLSIRNILDTPFVKDIAKYTENNKGEATSKITEIIPDELNRYEPFPLTGVQQAYWLGRKGDFELGDVGTHSYREITFKDLDTILFSKQLNVLIQRHDMLRMVIDDNGEQRVLENVPFYKIKEYDLTSASEEEKARHVETIRNEMSHQVFIGSDWPLFDLRFSRYQNKIVFHYSIDALMLDVSSALLLVKELVYLLSNPDQSLPPLELRFRDYVLAEVALRETPIFKKAESYWLSRIEDFPPRPDLPLATDPSQISNPRFERRHNTLSAQHWQVLKARAQQHQLTPTVLFLGCFAEVLNRWSQQAHFALNLTLFNRMPFHPQVNDILGDFTTLTLLEMDYREAGKHFLERLDAIQKQLWSDLEHREFGGIDFLRALHSAGESNSYPVVVTSTLGLEKADNDAQNNADNNTHNNDWLIEDESYGISQTSQVWLDVQVGESESGGLSYNWDSVAELFPAGMLDDMFSALGHLLEHLATQETLWQKPIKIDLPPAQQQLIEKVNSTTMSLPEGLLHEPILEQIAEQGDKVAVTTADYSLSYRELGERSQQLAHHLIQGGARANQLIAIVMEKGWEQVVAVLGILRSGAAYLPIDGSQPEERIHLLLESAEVEQVVTTQAYREKIPAALRTLVLNHDDDKQKLSTQDSPVQNKTTDLAYVIFTSGSTGIPKGVMIDHRGALNTVNDINQRYQVSSADSVFGLSNLNFDLSVYDIFGVLGAGGTLVLPCAREYRDPAAWLKYLHANQVTLWNTVPALMQMLVEHLDGQDNTTTEHQALNLRLVLMSGDWIPVDLPDRIRTLAPDADLISLGGATEASIWSIYYPIQDVGKQWKSIPYGKALANQQFYVLQSDLQLSAPGVTGDLYIGGIGLAQGYWRDEEKTAASFIQHPDTGVALYRTGDRGRLLADGNIEFMGRIDQQVKVQGYRIELGEIEARLKAHPQVHDTVVSTFRANNSVQLVAYVAGEKREADAEGQADTLSASEKIDFKLSHKSVRNEEGECISLETGTEMLTLRSPSLPVSKPVFDALALSDLSALLKIFYRKPITGQALPKGYYPSGGTLYPVQVYLHIPANTVLLETGAIAAGYYYYHPLNHQLVLLTQDDPSSEDSHSAAENHAPELFLIGDLNAIAPLYGQASQALCELEAGYMSALLLQYQGHVGAEEQPRALLTDTQKAAFKLTEQHQMLTSFRCGNVSEENTTEQNNTALTVRCASNGAPCQFQFSGEAAPQALSCINRKSYRQYQEAAPSLEQLGQLLSVLPLSSALHYYINLHKDHQASDSDVRLPAGQYEYDVSTNSLRIVQTGNVGKLFTGGNQEIEARASFSLFISSASSKNLQEAGRIGQYLSNQVKASRTGLCPIGAVNDAAVANAFNLDAGEKVLHSFIGGAVSQAQIDNPEVESTAPAAQSIESVLSEHLAQTLPHYMIPSHFIVLESIPLTANGKVNRKALPEPDVEHEVQAYVAPTNETETQLCKLWQDILNVERVGITDNFFHLGGHSLLAIRFLRAAQDQGISLKTEQIYAHPTIRELGKYCLQKTDSRSSHIISESRFLPLTADQAYSLDRPEVREHFFINISFTPEFKIKEDILQQALEKLVQTHEVLGARFFETESGWRQKIVVTEEGSAQMVAVHDLECESNTDHTEALIKDVIYAMHSSMPLEAGPQLYASVVNFTDDKQVILFSVSHFVCDAYSMYLLMDDLMDLYAKLSTGNESYSLPKAGNAVEWLELYEKHLNSNRLLDQVEYWESLPWQNFKPLPVDFDKTVQSCENTTESSRQYAFNISKDLTKIIQDEIPATTGVSVRNFMYFVIMEALCDWGNLESLGIELFDNGRDYFSENTGYDLSRVVAAFAFRRCLYFNKPTAENPLERLLQTDTSINGVPDKGLGYMMLRDACEDAAIRKRMQNLPTFEVWHNHRGVANNESANANTEKTPIQKAINAVSNNKKTHRERAFLFFSGIYNGEMQVKIEYSAVLHSEKTIKALSKRITKKISHTLSKLDKTKNKSDTTLI